MKSKFRFGSVLFALFGTMTACVPTALRDPGQFVPIVPIGRFENKKLSSVGGYAEIFPYSDGKSRIRVRLGNLPAESVRAGSIVYGDCEGYSNTALSKLEPIRADREGVGTVLSVIETDKLSTTINTKAPLAILYYQRGETDTKGIGEAIACGEFIYRK